MDEVIRKLLNKYAGQSIEYALNIERDGKTIVSHLEDLISKEYARGIQVGKKQMLERVSLYSDINSVKGREAFRKNLDDFKKELEESVI